MTPSTTPPTPASHRTSPLLQRQFPEITDFYLPPEGRSYRMALVQIKKAYPGHALLVQNTPTGYLDFASPVSGLGSKIGLDATNKWPG